MSCVQGLWVASEKKERGRKNKRSSCYSKKILLLKQKKEQWPKKEGERRKNEY
jgi:hypothetical protein